VAENPADAKGERSVNIGGGVHGSIIVTGDGNIIYTSRPPSYHAPFQAPPLPRHFVPRPEVSRDLKARFLGEDGHPPGVLVVSAIHGLGGIGKSTLAAALARDPEVLARFPDGILWATLGQQPDVLSLLVGWIQSLGDYDFRPTTPQVATAHLRTLLHDKTALLVVDDAWDPTHVRPFLAGGSRCWVLITTREAVIAKAVGADLYELDVMTPAQALALLEGRLRRKLGMEEQASARELARVVEYLPLALELAAAQVADGVRWNELLKDLKAEIARLEALDFPGVEEVIDEAIRKRLSLLASFNLSLRRLPGERRTDFAWLGVLPEDVSLTPAMMATVWGKGEREAWDVLRYLQGKALLLPGTPRPDGILTYRLHDLLHDLARRLLTTPPKPAREGDLPGLGIPLEEAHRLLLEQYRARTRDGLWHTLPDDGYIHARLTWHMEQAGEVEAIHALLREETEEGRNGWYEARERLGQTVGFLADVARAWRLAEDQFATRHSPSAIGLQCRYALITASLNSLAKNIPPALLAALVEKEVWTPAQGLAYARQVPDTEQRARALVGLAPHLTEGLLEEALAAAREIQDEDDRAWALAGLAPHLPESMLREALAATRDIRDGNDRAWALVKMIPYLSEELLLEALAAAREIEDEYWRAKAAAGLAHHLPDELREKALNESWAAVWGIKVLQRRDGALALLSLCLAELGYSQEALSVVRAIESASERAEALGALAPYLPGKLSEAALGEALDAVEMIEYEWMRASTLEELAPRLTKPLLHKALAIARKLSTRDTFSVFGNPCGSALAALAPHLAKTSHALPQKALAMAREIESKKGRADALIALAPYLSETEREGVLLKALAAAREIEDKQWRANALIALALQLAGTKLALPLLREALAAAQDLPEQEEIYSPRANALACLAPHLPESLLEEALAAVREIKNMWARVKAFAVLIPYTAGVSHTLLLREALAAAREINDESWCSDALTELTSCLAKAYPEEALEVAREIPRSIDRAIALARLTPHLPKPLLREVLVAIREIENNDNRTVALAGLSPYLPTRLLREALTIAQEIRDADDRVRALTALAHYLPKPLLEEALVAAQGIRKEWTRSRALARLVPRLAELGYPQEALAAAREIEDGHWRARALEGLASHLADPRRRRALVTARELPEQDLFGSPRIESLSALAPRLAEWTRRDEIAYAVLGETLHSLAQRTRKDLLDDLRDLPPRIAALGGVEAVAETFRAVQDVGRWWP